MLHRLVAGKYVFNSALIYDFSKVAIKNNAYGDVDTFGCSIEVIEEICECRNE